MPDNNKPQTSETSESDDKYTLHTCACGEKHRHRPGSGSHRDDCTSPKKFGESCCCGPAPEGMANRHRCGYGPRCQ